MRYGIGLAIAAWGLLVGAGFAALAAYSLSPGPAGAPAPLDQTPLASDDGPHGWRLVMAVHPKCPCTAASLSELERLLAKAGPDLSCTVLAYTPSGAPSDWRERGVLGAATRLPRAEIVADTDGAVAASLGIETSGGVVLYDAHGQPRFHGGVTIARGHEGDNLGVDSVLALVRGETPPRESTSVYGCRIQSPAPADSGGVSGG